MGGIDREYPELDDSTKSKPQRHAASTGRVSEIVFAARGIRVCRYCTDPECENPLFCESYEPTTDQSTLSTVHMPGAEETQAPIKGTLGSALFGQHRLLLIDIEGVTSSLVLHASERIVLGRADTRPVSENFLDLNPYQAHNKGVSRMHATISQMGHTLMLTDMGSTNGTYINEVRLMPNQPRILRDGDMIRLGHLVAYVRFK